MVALLTTFCLHVQPFRSLPLAFALCLLLSELHAGESAASNRREITLTTVLGFNQHARSGHWCPLTVEIDYTPIDESEILEGELRLYALADGETNRRFYYSRPISLGRGRKALSLYCFPAQHDLATGMELVLVRTGDNGEESAAVNPVAIRPPMGVSPNDILMVELSREARLPLAIWCREYGDKLGRYTFETRPDPGSRYVHGRLDPLFAPDHWLGYDGVDVLVWDRPEPTRLRPQQLQAIRDYVARGGHLALFFDASAPLPELAAIDELLPGRTPRHQRVDLPIGRDESFRRLPAPLVDLATGVWQFPYLEAKRSVYEVKTNAKTLPLFVPQTVTGTRWPAGAQQPLLLRRHYGAGRVTLVTFDPASPPLDNYAGRQALVGRALGLVFDPADLDQFAEAIQPLVLDTFRNRTPESTVPYNELALRHLARSPALRPAPFYWIASFLLLYTLVIGSFDYWLLRRWRRLHWTWLTLTAYALVFSIAAYAGARHLRGTRSIVREVTVHTELPGPERVATRGLTGVFAPEYTRLDVSAGDESSLRMLDIRDLRSAFLQSRMDEPPAEIREHGGFTLMDVSLRQWSMKSFETRGLQPDRGVLQGNLHCRADGLGGTLRVAEGTTLHRAMLISRFGVWQIGTLENGAEWKPTKDKAEPFIVYVVGLRGLNNMSMFNDDVPGAPNLAAYSLGRILDSWTYLDALHLSQFEHPGPPAAPEAADSFALLDPDPPKKNEKSERNLGLRRGLSLEQIWNMCARPEYEDGMDLSAHILAGGAVLLARIERPAGHLTARERQFEREGYVLLRAVLPPADDRALRLWQDPLYGFFADKNKRRGPRMPREAP